MKKRAIAWLATSVLAMAGVSCASPPSLPGLPGLPSLPGWPSGPPVLVDLAHLAPGIQREIRYAGPDNFVGAPVAGYGAPRCWLSRRAAEALARVHEDLRAEGLGLRVYDCYRPKRAVDHFVRWAKDPAGEGTKRRYYPRVPKERLFEEGYIAERSDHSRASSVDLTLVRLPDWEPLDMGSPWDFFDPVSHTESPDVTPAQHENRMRLRTAMKARGFENFPKEWWHYTLLEEPWPDTYLDVPIH